MTSKDQPSPEKGAEKRTISSPGLDLNSLTKRVEEHGRKLLLEKATGRVDFIADLDNDRIIATYDPEDPTISLDGVLEIVRHGYKTGIVSPYAAFTSLCVLRDDLGYAPSEEDRNWEKELKKEIER